MPQTISILGCGWLGLSLAQHLLKKGFSVKGSTTSAEKVELLKAVGIEPFVLDIENPIENIDGFLKAEILILAIPSKNIVAFKKLVVKIESSPVLKVIFISSTSVYGDANGIVTEDFAVSGALAEIENFFKNSSFFKTVILRFGGLIGGERHPGRFFKNSKIVPQPDARVNMIHRDDCIAIIERVIEKNVWGETFNCCANTHPVKREFYTKAALDLGIEAPQFAEGNMKGFKIISNEKVKEFLDYNFKYPDLMDLPNENF
ncbi:MAG: SDR family oxidoreductase [Bacteroidota bacterium]